MMTWHQLRFRGLHMAPCFLVGVLGSGSQSPLHIGTYTLWQFILEHYIYTLWHMVEHVIRSTCTAMRCFAKCDRRSQGWLLESYSQSHFSRSWRRIERQLQLSSAAFCPRPVLFGVSWARGGLPAWSVACYAFSAML